MSSKPQHYQTSGIDVIDICKLYDLNFNRGNILKDDEVKDLEKALDYLNRELKYLKEL